MEELVPDMDCELVDLTAVPLSQLRSVDDRVLSDSMRRLLNHADNPDTRSSRMSTTANDCSGNEMDEFPEGPKVALPITC